MQEQKLDVLKNPMSFSKKKILNGHDHPCMQSLTFPTLSPHDEIGDVNNSDLVSKVTLIELNENLIKHCIHNDTKNEHFHPFVEHYRWMQKNSERHRANGETNVCFKNSGDNNLMEEQLKTSINNSGEELQKFGTNANI